jgi:hypothetical protein
MDEKQVFSGALRSTVVLALALAILTSAANAWADDEGTIGAEPAAETKRYYNRPPVRFDGPYDPTVAFCWSLFPGLIGVGAGVGLAAGGDHLSSLGMMIAGHSMLGVSLIVGPSLGLFYADHLQRGLISLFARLVLVGTSFSVWLVGSVRSRSEEEQADEDEQDWDFFGVVELYVWALAIFGPLAGATALGVIDTIAAPRAARRANVSYHRRDRSWLVAPTVIADQRGKAGPGIALVGTF